MPVEENAVAVGALRDRTVRAVLGFAGATVINRNTTRPHAAALLADWMLGQESQRYLAAGFRGP